MFFLKLITITDLPCKNKKAFNGVFSKVNAKTGVKWCFNGVSRRKLHETSLFPGICENALTFSQLFIRDWLLNSH
jgi:hypothetical protein